MTTKLPEPTKPTTASTPQDQHRRKPGQIALFAVGAVAGVVVLTLVLLPAIIANTSLKDLLLSAAFADKDVEVTIDKVRVSWFAPTEVDVLQLKSRLNDSQAVIPKVTTDASLFWLAAAPSNTQID